MVFSSYTFILTFLPVVVLTYYALSHLKDSLYQRLFLIAASLFFYGYYNVRYLALIVVSIVINYLVATGIQKTSGRKSQLFLTVGVLLNVGLIGYFKYYDFFIENINLLFGSDFALRHILLPLGISFFTFQQLSFLVSVYQKEEKVERLRDYILFVTFFPQLVAGPIVLYSEMIPQFKDEQRRFFNAENFSAGIYLFAIGLFKKAVIADTLAVWVDNGFGMGAPGLVGAWATALSYTLQIYFDFSGYSDMAVGLARMFNIEIPFNFISPYRSCDITEFWRRWHITLGRALSAYVYKPLGGNRRGLPRTCLSVNALWVLFRAESFSQAMTIYKGMVDFNHVNPAALNTLFYDGVISFPSIANYAFVTGTLATLLGVVFFGTNSSDLLQKFNRSKYAVLVSALLFCISILCLGRNSVFIYFNF